MGIGRTFQNIELFEHETVLQNLLVGRFIKRKTNFLSEIFFLPKVRKQEIKERRKVEEIIDLFEIEAYRDQVVSTLPYGIQKLIEIGRALATEPELLILDEPTSGLNIDETEDLTWWITDINEELGVTIVLIEHDMRVVRKISNRVCVLDQGIVIANGEPDEVMDDPKVKTAYLGEE
jgi:branched-chain amino acid transport system ATP-binding protein